MSAEIIQFASKTKAAQHGSCEEFWATCPAFYPTEYLTPEILGAVTEMLFTSPEKDPA